MRDYSQIDLIDMCNRKRELAGSNDNEGPDASEGSPVIDWLGARKPLHLIAMACAVIAVARCLVEWFA
jgi:hypothetical protein